eukprot:TRINITY_DN5287_c0_g1_i1.p1 TRINITY_DN5287_c0_g1~~TRINITY_DN5287_c0_g1_i1.p1  ORF type:complete len:715 (-),score=143.48 TRINITY_DN5287_c0_g1_i1:362-2506(-)
MLLEGMAAGLGLWDSAALARDVNNLFTAVGPGVLRSRETVGHEMLKPLDAVLCIEGYLPSMFQAKMYQVPIKLFVPRAYPVVPPVCFVVPSPDLMLNPRHPFVDANTGVCHPPLRWAMGNSLTDFATSLVNSFSEMPPIVDRPDPLQTIREQQQKALLLRQQQLDLQMQTLARDPAFNPLAISVAANPSLALTSSIAPQSLSKSSSGIYNNERMLDIGPRSRAPSDSTVTPVMSSSESTLATSKSDYNLPSLANLAHQQTASQFDQQSVSALADSLASFDAFRAQKANGFEHDPSGGISNPAPNGSAAGPYSHGVLSSSQTNPLPGHYQGPGRLTVSSNGEDMFKPPTFADERMRKSHSSLSLPASASFDSPISTAKPAGPAPSAGPIGPAPVSDFSAQPSGPYALPNSAQNASAGGARELRAATSMRDLRSDGEPREAQQQPVSRTPGDNPPQTPLTSLTSSGTFSVPSLVKSATDGSVGGGGSSLFSSALFHPSAFAAESYSSFSPGERNFMRKSGSVSPPGVVMLESEFFKQDPNVPLPAACDGPLESPEEELACLKEEREEDQKKMQDLEQKVAHQARRIKELEAEVQETEIQNLSIVDEMRREHSVAVDRFKRELAHLNGDELDTLDLSSLRDLAARLKDATMKVDKAIELESQKHEEARLCAVCLENEKDTLLLPCSHLVICESCSRRNISLCPVCRKKITKMKRVYL